MAARKSRPKRQQRTERKGSIGGRRFGPGKRRHWCAACGKGPRFFSSSSPTSEPRKRGATGSVRGLIVRPAHRKRTPARGLTPLNQKGEAAPGKTRRGEDESRAFGRTGRATAGARDANCGATWGRRCLRAIRRRSGGRGLSSAQACWAKAGFRRGGQRGESLVLESRWAPGVLVDKKSVAEIR